MENKDQEIMGMNISVHAISIVVDILLCTSTEDIQAATTQDSYLPRLKSYIMQGWPHIKEDMEHRIQKSW